MNAVTENWTPVGMLADIPQRGARRIVWGAAAIAVFRTADDNIFAIEDKCPHKAGPLSQGIIHDNCVTCPLHNWVISLETGEAQGADDGAVRAFRVKLGKRQEILLDASSLRSAVEAAG